MKHTGRKLLSLLTVFCMVFTLMPLSAVGAEEKTFSDMPSADKWSYEALTAAVDNGLMQGSGGMICPGNTLTRAEMAAMVNRAFGAQDKASLAGFTDVAAGDWFYDDMAKAVAMKTFEGTGNQLMPNAAITREQAFTVLARALVLSDEGGAAALAKFSDADSVSAWAWAPLGAMAAAGYVAGSDGKLNPKGNITREEFAQVMLNTVGGYIAAAGECTETVTEGNVMINVPGVTLKGVTVKGDLIVGDGVGNGEAALDGVTVTGRLVVRGGGVNTVLIKNKSSVGSVVIAKTSDGQVRLRTEEGCKVDVVVIDDGKDDVILEGTFNQVTVATDAPVVLKNSSVAGLTVSAEGAAVKTEGTTAVTSAKVEKAATGAAITVAEGTTVAKVESAAEKVSIDGAGKVTSVTVSGNDTKVDVAGAKVTAEAGTTGVTQNGNDVAAVVPSGGGGSSSSTTVVVTTDAQLLAALQNPRYEKIWLGYNSDTMNVGDDTTDTKDYRFFLSVPEGQETLVLETKAKIYVGTNGDGNPMFLSIGDGVTLTAPYLRCNGYVQVMKDAVLNVKALELLGSNGVLENRGEITVSENLYNYAGYIADAGTFHTEGLSEEGMSRTLNWGDYDKYIPGPALVDDSTEANGTMLTADAEMPEDITLTKSTFIPYGTALLVGSELEENLPYAALDDSVLNLNGGTLYVAGAMMIGEGSTLNNAGWIDILHGSLINKGTLNNGDKDSWGQITSIGNCTITNSNGAEFVNEGYLSVEDGGILDNAGDFVNKNIMELTDSTLKHSGAGAKFDNSGDINLYGGGLTLSEATEDSFLNVGYMKIMDLYEPEGKKRICVFNLTDVQKVFNTEPKDSQRVQYAAEVVDTTGMSEAAEAQTLKKQDLAEKADLPLWKSTGNPEETVKNAYAGLITYDAVEIRGDVTIGGNTVLDAFENYWIQGYWGENDPADPGDEGGWDLIPVTMTVEQGAEVTLKGPNALHVSDGGVLDVKGTLITEARQEEERDDNMDITQEYKESSFVEIWPAGSFKCTGTVENNGEIVIRYEEETDEDWKPVGILNRSGTVNGAPEKNITFTATVFSEAGLRAANESSAPAFYGIEIRNGSDITLTESMEIAKDVYIEPGSGLCIPYGETLTLSGEHDFFNEGDVSVYGELYIGEDYWFWNGNNLEVGASSGGNIARLDVRGLLLNENCIDVNPTGRLFVVDGLYYGNNPDYHGVVPQKLNIEQAEYQVGNECDFRNVRFIEEVQLTVDNAGVNSVNFENCEFTQGMTVLVGTDSIVDMNLVDCALGEGASLKTEAMDGAIINHYKDAVWRGSGVYIMGADGFRVDASVPTCVELLDGGSFVLNGIRVVGIENEGDSETDYGISADVKMLCYGDHGRDYDDIEHGSCRDGEGQDVEDSPGIAFGGSVANVTFVDSAEYGGQQFNSLDFGYWNIDSKSIKVSLGTVSRPDGVLRILKKNSGSTTVTVEGSLTAGTIETNTTEGMDTSGVVVSEGAKIILSE